MRITGEIVIIILGLCCSLRVAAQDSSGHSGVLQYPNKLFAQMERKATAIERGLVRKQQKFAHSLKRQEKKLQEKLAKKDSAAAANIFGNTERFYHDLNTKTKSSDNRTKYLSHLDSVSTGMRYLVEQGISNSPQADGALAKLNKLSSQFSQADESAKLLEERRAYLQQKLSEYNMGKALGGYKKQLYYYKAQVSEYQSLMQDPSKLEAKMLSMLQQSAAYKDFFSRNSQLASLFRLQATNLDAAPAVSLRGLSTRANVQQELLARTGSRGLPPQMQDHIQGAQTALKKLKQQAEQAIGSEKETDMPNFKPNHQKTKRFMDRLEYSFNMQSTKTSGWLPATSDIGSSIGYKLNDKSIVGVGIAYKIGWGQDIRHIQVSHQGLGLRTFVEYKVKGSFWFSGGAEINYRSAFNNIEELRNSPRWQRSALAGFSKKYKIGGGKKGSFQLLYDFLHMRQTPRTQPIVFRFGYQLK